MNIKYMKALGSASVFLRKKKILDSVNAKLAVCESLISEVADKDPDVAFTLQKKIESLKEIARSKYPSP